MADVLIVGAGPVGLSLGLALARAGFGVTVLEKEPSTAVRSRAPLIWPGALEVLADLGVAQRLLAQGIVLDRLHVWDADHGKRRLDLSMAELSAETMMPQLCVLPQPETERILCEELSRYPNAQVQFSREVVAVGQEPGLAFVQAVDAAERDGAEPQTIEARFVVGCDGAHSSVRRFIGATSQLLPPGTTRDTRVALADLWVPRSEHLPFPRVTTRDVVAVGIRMRGPHWRLVLPLSDRDRLASDHQVSIEERVERARAALFGERAQARLEWSSELTLDRRISTRYVRERIALAGDAAHLDLPVAGQSISAGIKESALLARCLIAALIHGDPSALAPYEDRRPATERRVNALADRLARALLTADPAVLRAVLMVAEGALRIGALRHRFLRRLAMLDGPMAIEQAERGPAGEPAGPDDGSEKTRGGAAEPAS